MGTYQVKHFLQDSVRTETTAEGNAVRQQTRTLQWIWHYGWNHSIHKRLVLHDTLIRVRRHQGIYGMP